jgi:hypothetical protein
MSLLLFYMQTRCHEGEERWQLTVFGGPALQRDLDCMGWDWHEPAHFRERMPGQALHVSLLQCVRSRDQGKKGGTVAASPLPEQEPPALCWR